MSFSNIDLELKKLALSVLSVAEISKALSDQRDCTSMPRYCDYQRHQIAVQVGRSHVKEAALAFALCRQGRDFLNRLHSSEPWLQVPLVESAIDSALQSLKSLCQASLWSCLSCYLHKPCSKPSNGMSRYGGSWSSTRSQHRCFKPPHCFPILA